MAPFGWRRDENMTEHVVDTNTWLLESHMTATGASALSGAGTLAAEVLDEC